MDVTVVLLFMRHPVAVCPEGNQIRGGVHFSLMLRKWSDVMDLDVAVCIVSSVDLIEVEAADLAHRAVYLYRYLSILPASLIGEVLGDPPAAFAIWDHRLVHVPVCDYVYLQGALCNLLAPVSGASSSSQGNPSPSYARIS